MKKELGIYIHIPFCKQKCYYCDFVSFPDKINLQEKYIETLIKELKSFNLEEYDVTTIYIGGGTPSFISSDLINIVLEFILEKI